MSEITTTLIQPPRSAARIRPALMAKEWFEHRWRFALGTIVLSTLLGGMLRAQVVPFHEAAIAIFWPVGTIMTIFLAMGPVAMEKTQRTWEFLLAQPVPKGKILLAKWRMGLYELIGMNFIACLAGLTAMWSRGFYGRGSFWQEAHSDMTSHIEKWLQLIIEHPGLWLILLAALATVALSCWYTFLFFMLTRARNEFEAALGGLLLTIAAHVWLGQVNYPGLRVPLGLNPFAMFLVLIYPQPPYFAWLPLTLMIVVQLVVWIGLPVLVIGWQTRRRANV